MAQRFLNPYPQFLDSTPSVYSGGKLYFYTSGTSSLLDTFSDEALSIANTNPVILSSAGRPSVAIFLSNVAYKVVLKDASDNEIWTIDPYYGTDLKSVAVTKVGSGSPSGVVAGTAGSSGVLPTMYWDYTNAILYVCTTTGSAAVAVWTAVNAAAATVVVVPPQGYLTPDSANPVIASDSTSATTVSYVPFVGNLLPIYNGSRHVPTEFTALTLTLHSSHAINTIYDVFGFSNSGVVTLATGPAWSNSGAGTGARGTGAGTTELTRLNGFLVNNVAITGRNGATTYSIGANLATYLGSIFIDGTAGQVSCHRSWGQSRKWGIWNAYNRQPVYLKAGDSTASWSYGTNTIRASNNASGNKLTVFSGLAEEFYRARFAQKIGYNDNAGATVNMQIGIGYNSTTAFSGQNYDLTVVYGAGANSNHSGTPQAEAEYFAAPSLGINDIQALERTPNAGTTNDYYGTEANMVLSAVWPA